VKTRKYASRKNLEAGMKLYEGAEEFVGDGDDVSEIQEEDYAD
jgi:hypothetical protein